MRKVVSREQDRFDRGETDFSRFGDMISAGHALKRGDPARMASVPKVDSVDFGGIFEKAIRPEPLGPDFGFVTNDAFSWKETAGLGPVAAAAFGGKAFHDSRFDFSEAVVLSFAPRLDMLLPEAGSDVAPSALSDLFGFY